MAKIYLACPYAHDDANVRQARYIAVTKYAADLVADTDNLVFSPITHSHPLFEMRPDCGGSWEAWRAFDESMLDWCDEMWVLCVPGWRESRGVRAEMDYCLVRGIPVQWRMSKPRKSPTPQSSPEAPESKTDGLPLSH